jgi:queuosine precursor transporter
MALTSVSRKDGGQRLHFLYLDWFIYAFVAILLVSNLVAAKLCEVGPFLLSGAQLLFPITYIFGDIFTEVYGYAASRRAIWAGFFASFLMAFFSAVIVALPPAPSWQLQKEFETVLGFVPRAVTGSLIAYLIGEFCNSYVLSRLKTYTNGKHLWMRTIASTAVGQLIDTVVVMLFLFVGVLSSSEILRLIISGYVGKVLYEVLATPLTYLVVNRLKQAEGVDVYDQSTDFSPFRAN